MIEMLTREMRMVDIQIVNNLLRNTTFFASTTILILAGLAASFGAADTFVMVTTDLPFVQETTRAAWEIKILLLIFIFIYAFFKFSWSIRLHSYTAVLLGAAPGPPADGAVLSQNDLSYARELGRVSTLAADHFNNGIRAYYFGLAAVTWFVHPMLVFAATVWVLIVLYRREFRSRSLRHLIGAKSARDSGAV